MTLDERLEKLTRTLELTVAENRERDRREAAARADAQADWDRRFAESSARWERELAESTAKWERELTESVAKFDREHERSKAEWDRRYEGLTLTVQLIGVDIRNLLQYASQDAENIRALVRVAEAHDRRLDRHEERINDLEDDRQ